MKYATVFSGIEAPSMAWHDFGWQPLFFSEIERFASGVLAHRFPDVPNLGDVSRIHETEQFRESIGATDLIIGGSPCQSFSIAGLREGLDDPRGNLALVYLSVIDRLRPRWFIWENVPGVLSSKGGRDFETFTGAITKIGYQFAWRILDAQFFGVPQRRCRVILVGHYRDWRGPAAVLFEPQSMQRNSETRRKERKEIAGTLSSRASAGGFPGSDDACNGYVIPVCVTGNKTHALTAEGHDASEDGTGRGAPIVFDPTQITHPENRSNPKPGGKSHSIPAHGSPPVLAFGGGNSQEINRSTCLTRHGVRLDFDTETFVLGVTIHGTSKTQKIASSTDVAGAIRTKPPGSQENSSTTAVLHGRSVRRLTPVECERLQGFPDDFTMIPWKNKMAWACPDGPRYKALGNSMAVPVIRWIGDRIRRFELIQNEISQRSA